MEIFRASRRNESKILLSSYCSFYKFECCETKPEAHLVLHAACFKLLVSGNNQLCSSSVRYLFFFLTSPLTEKLEDATLVYLIQSIPAVPPLFSLLHVTANPDTMFFSYLFHLLLIPYGSKEITMSRHGQFH